MRILIASGGSGGHIFPAVGFFEALKGRELGHDVLFILPQRPVAQKIKLQGCKVEYVSLARMGRGVVAVASLHDVVAELYQAARIMCQFKPHTVVGFGSLLSAPFILAGVLSGASTIIHEQNVIPGRATRFLAPMVGRIALSFKASEPFFYAQRAKICITGNPLRNYMRRIDTCVARKQLGLEPDALTLLVMGGSQGSSCINNAAVQAVAAARKHAILQVIHLTGKADCVSIRSVYRDMDVKAYVADFLPEMQYAYSAADIAISRAGATSIAELLLYHLPAVLIPYPYAHGHQLANARVLADMGAACMFEEKDSAALPKCVVRLCESVQMRQDMKRAYSNIPSANAAEALVDVVLGKV